MAVVERVDEAAAFLHVAEALLLADEPRHNLILGLAGVLRDQPGLYAEHDLRVARRGGQVEAVAFRTPPLNVLVAGADGVAVAALADALHAGGVQLPGVTAARPEADTFAARWLELAGGSASPRVRQRIYLLRRLVPPRPTSGSARAATTADRDLLVAWVGAFSEELGDRAVRSPEATVDARLESGGFTLWEDRGEPVSVAGWGSPTPNGIRIGPVYTPPEHRGRGYGSSATAAASAEQLAAGRTFCFLYTDLANPTSNKIYLDLGYEPVCDSVEYAFEPA